MPAVTRNQYGKGCTYYLGANMVHSGITKVLDMAVQNAGVTPVISESTDLEVTCRKTADGTYYFIFNFKDQELPIPACFASMTDLLTGETICTKTCMNQYDALLVFMPN